MLKERPMHFYRPVDGVVVNAHGTEFREVVGQLLRVPFQTCCARKGPYPDCPEPRVSGVPTLPFSFLARPFHPLLRSRAVDLK